MSIDSACRVILRHSGVSGALEAVIVESGSAEERRAAAVEMSPQDCANAASLIWKQVPVRPC